MAVNVATAGHSPGFACVCRTSSTLRSTALSSASRTATCTARSRGRPSRATRSSARRPPRSSRPSTASRAPSASRTGLRPTPLVHFPFNSLSRCSSRGQIYSVIDSSANGAKRGSIAARRGAASRVQGAHPPFFPRCRSPPCAPRAQEARPRQALRGPDRG